MPLLFANNVPYNTFCLSRANQFQANYRLVPLLVLCQIFLAKILAYNFCENFDLEVQLLCLCQNNLLGTLQMHYVNVYRRLHFDTGRVSASWNVDNLNHNFQ